MESNIGEEAKALIPINDNIGVFVTKGISAILIVASVATFAYLVWGGIQWITSGGTKDKIQEAKDKITNAIIGLAIVASAWAVYLLIDYFFGIGLTTKL